MPINELLPEEEGYEYPSGMSFFPFRRKAPEWRGVPYAIPFEGADKPGNLELTLPGFARTMLNDLWLAFTGPGHAAAGDYTPNELEEVGMRAGSALTWGGMAVPKPTGAISGIFGGSAAKTANKAMLGKAMSLESRGASPSEIVAATGWFHDVDGNWKFEISDEGAKLKEGLPRNKFDPELTSIPFGAELKMKDVLDHPELYKAYPDVAEMPVRSTGLNFGLKGAHDPEKNTIYLAGGRDKDTTSTALHETQHAIQSREGFARGGNVDEWLTPEFKAKAKEVEAKWNIAAERIRKVGANPFIVRGGLELQLKGKEPFKYHLEDMQKLSGEELNVIAPVVRDLIEVDKTKNAAFDMYQKLAGEVESRNVQERFENPTRAMPWETPGYVPRKDQLVLFDEPGKRKLSASAEPKSASAKELLDDFTKLHDEINEKLKKLGYTIHGPSSYGDYGLADLKSGELLDEFPGHEASDLIQKLNDAAGAYDDAMATREFNKYGVQGKPKTSPLDEFNETYAKAQEFLKKNWSSLGIGTDKNTGDFIITWGDTGDNFHPTSEELTGLLKNLNEAKAKYVVASSGQQPFVPQTKSKPKENELGATKYMPMDDFYPIFDEAGKVIDEHGLDMGFLDGYSQWSNESGPFVKDKAGNVLLHSQIPPKVLASMEKLWDAVSKLPPKSKAQVKLKKTSKPGKTMTLGKADEPPSYLEQMKPEQMREYSPSELDWEYEKEVLEYAPQFVRDAFADRTDFQRQYDMAPLRVLSQKELKNLEYATIGGLLGPNQTVADKVQKVFDAAGHRRDVPKIMETIRSGQTAPPIVVKHDDGMRILGGNTRLMSALALGKNMPVKVIDIRSFPRRGSHHFDTTSPLSSAQRAENFNRWFAGSKLVDENGDPMIFYHGTDAPDITAIDIEHIKKLSGRDFLSTSRSQKFASNWAGSSTDDRGPLVYPVYISAKNPGDFRNPEHVMKAAEWKTEDALKDEGWSKERIDSARQKAKTPRPLFNVGKSEAKEYKDKLDYNIETAKTGIWNFWEDTKMWKALGWDGAFMTENGNPNGELNFAVPNPTQVKSIFNKGWWDKDDPRILYSGGAGIPLDLEPVDYDPFTLEPVAGDPFEEKKDDKSKSSKN